MSQQWAAKSVVVGIDGSRAAINAAKWAVAEATRSLLPLRLVYVLSIAKSPPASAGAVQPTLERAQNALSTAEYAVHSVRKSVDVETALLRGDPDDVLIDESRDAAMVCVGSKPQTDTLLGSTAGALARHAHCPVAIIRTDSYAPHTDGGAIAVVRNDESDNDAVVHAAMEEGRLRRATVRQIDLRTDSWVRRYPDVHVQILAEGPQAQYPVSYDPTIQLAVVGRAEADEITQPITPSTHPLLGEHPNCSVLVIRD